ncbi:ABC transporter substrate-binding protein [Frankia sp. AgB1.9]|nr:ABC transporter substrate-binding protein [Frankia sp. AgW1.1]MBL7547985.1 ABC transporter substrate-binding protein [Frankia sp. AgB1.9]MBL7625022.1 ABC transporter substrate-binding protein [Frankia sp. AgB1.8]
MLALVAAVLIIATGCRSTASTGKANGGATSGTRTYTIGVLTDSTGPAASGNKTSVDGVKAGTVLASRDGYTIKYVVGDTMTSPATALSAAQKLVTQDHVFAVIAYSALTFAASSYLTAHGVPVVGGAIDGPEWITSKNMFSVFGALHTTNVATTMGKFFKMQGVTSLASLGYSISPSSSESAKASAESARAAGVTPGYLNASFPFGSTNVEPETLAMKSAGIDGFVGSTDPNTAFALITSLRQNGVNLKVALLPTGYGGDLLQAGPGALNAAQNVYFSLGYEPVEMNTAATKQFASDLKAAGVAGEPTVAQYNGYVSVGLLLRGLKNAGPQPTQASLITAFSNIHDFTALGLFGSHKLDINDRDNIVLGADNCVWVTKLEGSSFKLVPGADPVCGTVIPGKTVSPSS